MPDAPKVLLGVTGSIAAYKAVDLLRRMQRNGWDVWVVMTACATQYVGPLTFRALTGHPVAHGAFADLEQETYTHLGLSENAAAMVVAPCSAQSLARLAHGFADDVLSCAALSLRAPLLVAPAMNTRMWEHPAVRDNVAALRRRGAVVVEPGAGELACGDVGAGRLAELDDVVSAVEAAIAAAG
jgi:phosphopantothenoylcysteine decarboxylase / phosphopantothenate---cysteine ligase